jgi:hypothetical protein
MGLAPSLHIAGNPFAGHSKRTLTALRTRSFPIELNVPQIPEKEYDLLIRNQQITFADQYFLDTKEIVSAVAAVTVF